MRIGLTISVLTAAWLVAAPARALDCAKANTPIETAICANPAALAADEAMTKTYDGLAASLKPEHRQALLISQRRWLEQRANLCVSEEGKAVDSCLVEKTDDRRSFLAGEPQSGPGAPPGFAPLFIQHVGKPREYDINVEALKFVDPKRPGEILFNQKVQALLDEVPPVRDKDIRDGQTYSYWLEVSAPFASEKFVSGHTELYDYSGGAHGNTETSNFAIDLASGRELAFADIFEEAAKQPLEDSCLAQIKDQKHEKLPDVTLSAEDIAALEKAIAVSVAELKEWSFMASKATIGFDAYALGAYVEGSYSCSFPAAFFKKFLKYDYLPPAPDAQ
ncbi:protein of unknown function DUF1311 [Methylocella silvestris BL2]|uniref:Lysozyme inhibitor LprI-like N-terminal domain-containing protein n=1 Tax=Methylocella silvestris (strain DSM 15510 / CIP 108128 / LMG 27833 / NCIMB 13906 / BL2) TaxID=395965 RepID=B8ETE5_METSB|nr:lysozyme inhibitor LprI family protein [Methylocella silvestris]ACK51787.1 protein of unknown function DUF1311 [Methylocella silvestris BL2]